MRKLCLPLLLGLLILVASRASAAISTSTITGQVFKADGTADANDVIWFTPNPPTQTVAGGQITAQPVATTTDGNGNLVAITLAQGLTVSITLLNGATGPVTGCVPVTASATIISVMSCSNVSTFTGVHLNDLTTATGNYSLGGFGLTNVGSLTGGSALMSITGGSGGLNIAGANTAGLDVLNNISVNGVDNVKAFGAKGDDTTDDSAAFQAAINASCAVNTNPQIPKVYLPTAKYKILRPVVDSCSSNSSSPQQAPIVGDGQQVSTIDAAFYGPAVVAYPERFNSTFAHGMTVVAGPVGTGTKALNLTGIGGFDINHVDAPYSTGGTTWHGPFDNLAQFDFRVLDLVDTDTTVTRCLWMSQGAWNTVKDVRGGGTSIFVASDSGLGEVCVQGSTGKVQFELKVGGVSYSITTSTVATQGTHYEAELNLDGSHNINGYFGPAGGTITRIWQQTGTTGTTTQRPDENDFLFAGNVGSWPNDITLGGSGIFPWKGTVQSVQFSQTARNTAASYTADSANFAGDANTLLLDNFDLNQFPVTTNNGTLPITQVDWIKGQNTIPGWMEARMIGLGCCSGTVEMSNFGFNSANNTVGIDLDQPAADIHEVIPSGTYMGIEANNSSSFNSQVHDLMVSCNAFPGAFVGVGLALAGAGNSGGNLQSLRNVNCGGVEAYEILMGGGEIDNVFFQNNALSVCPAALNGNFTAANLFDDSENGGTFPAVCLRNSVQATVTHSSFGPQGGQPDIQLVGQVGSLVLSNNVFGFPGGATVVADGTFSVPTTLGGGASYPQSGVDLIFRDNLFSPTNSTTIPTGNLWATNVPYIVQNDSPSPQVIANAQIATTIVDSTAITAASPVSQAQPVGLRTGMLEITQFTFNGTGNNLSVTPPSGWTLIRADVTADNNSGCKLYSHPYAVSDASTFSWTYGALGGGQVRLWTFGVGGIDLFNPIQVSGANVASFPSTSIVAPAQTSTYGNEPVLSIVEINSGGNNLSATSGQPTNAEPLFKNMIGFLFPQVNSTAVPAITYSGATNASLVGQTVVFNPVSTDAYPSAITRNQVDQLLRGYFDATETVAPSGVAGFDILWADSTAHAFKVNLNNSGALQVPATSNGVVEFNISTSGLLGGLTSTAAATLLQACDVAVSAGHFTNLVIVNDLNAGTCATAPTYNIRDDTTPATGTALTGSTTAGQVTQAETLAFAAGDRICLVRTINGGTCTAPTFTVAAHVKEP